MPEASQTFRIVCTFCGKRSAAAANREVAAHFAKLLEGFDKVNTPSGEKWYCADCMKKRKYKVGGPEK